jgi:predicted amidophosphoribosyltransferase
LIEAKFRGVTRLIEPLAHATPLSVPLDWGIDLVVTIPLHSTRERRRGYNKAEIAARRTCAARSASMSRRSRACCSWTTSR